MLKRVREDLYVLKIQQLIKNNNKIITPFFFFNKFITNIKTFMWCEMYRRLNSQTLKKDFKNIIFFFQQ